MYKGLRTSLEYPRLGGQFKFEDKEGNRLFWDTKAGDKFIGLREGDKYLIRFTIKNVIPVNYKETCMERRPFFDIYVKRVFLKGKVESS